MFDPVGHWTEDRGIASSGPVYNSHPFHQSHNSYPEPWADPTSRSTLGFYNLHYRSTGVHYWGIYFLDPPRGLGNLYRDAAHVVLAALAPNNRPEGPTYAAGRPLSHS